MLCRFAPNKGLRRIGFYKHTHVVTLYWHSFLGEFAAKLVAHLGSKNKDIAAYNSLYLQIVCPKLNLSFKTKFFLHFEDVIRVIMMLKDRIGIVDI